MVKSHGWLSTPVPDATIKGRKSDKKKKKIE